MTVPTYRAYPTWQAPKEPQPLLESEPADIHTLQVRALYREELESYSRIIRRV